MNATPDSPGAFVLDGRNEYIQGHETEYVPHGYVTLEFDGDQMTEFVRQADGTAIELPKG